GAGSIQVTVTTDYYNNLFEYNTAGPGGSSTAESNNTASTTVASALAPYPDLQVANLAVSPASGTQIQSGGAVLVAWADSNSGTGAVSCAFPDYVLVQRANSDGLLTTLSSATVAGIGVLAAGLSSPQQYSSRLPDGAAGTGQIQVTVTADSSNNVFEFNIA